MATAPQHGATRRTNRRKHGHYETACQVGMDNKRHLEASEKEAAPCVCAVAGASWQRQELLEYTFTEVYLGTTARSRRFDSQT